MAQKVNHHFTELFCSSVFITIKNSGEITSIESSLQGRDSKKNTNHLEIVWLLADWWLIIFIKM